MITTMTQITTRDTLLISTLASVLRWFLAQLFAKSRCQKLEYLSHKAYYKDELYQSEDSPECAGNTDTLDYRQAVTQYSSAIRHNTSEILTIMKYQCKPLSITPANTLQRSITQIHNRTHTYNTQNNEQRVITKRQW